MFKIFSYWVETFQTQCFKEALKCYEIHECPLFLYKTKLVLECL